jgi:hypothetical protein
MTDGNVVAITNNVCRHQYLMLRSSISFENVWRQCKRHAAAKRAKARASESSGDRRRCKPGHTLDSSRDTLVTNTVAAMKSKAFAVRCHHHHHQQQQQQHQIGSPSKNHRLCNICPAPAIDITINTTIVSSSKSRHNASATRCLPPAE